MENMFRILKLTGLLLISLSLSACPLFRSTGGVVQSVGDGAEQVTDGVGNAIGGTGRAINRGVNGTVDSLD